MSATTTSTVPLLTIPEVARRLGLHRDTIYRKIARGEIPAVRLGSESNASLRVPADELERWLFAEAQE
jgi:excisionase family DNA binding protein